MKREKTSIRKYREYLTHRGRSHREARSMTSTRLENREEALPLSDVSAPVQLPPRLEAQLQSTDFDLRDVIVGFVKDQTQFQQCLEGNFYYTYVSAVADGAEQVRYAALYQRGRGVTHYGRVRTIHRAARNRLPGKARWPQEMCWVYLVENWLPVGPILPECYGPNPVSRTCYFLLTQARTYPQLHLESAEAFRFSWLLQAQAAARQSSHAIGAEGFTLGEIRVLMIENRILLFHSGTAVDEAGLEDFEKSPGQLTRRFLQRAGLHTGKFE